MDYNLIYKKYIERHPTCFKNNDSVKLNQEVGAIFTNHFMEEWGFFKEEIREISLDEIFELYNRKELDYQRLINENLTFEEYVKIFLELKRKTNSGKQITYIII